MNAFDNIFGRRRGNKQREAERELEDEVVELINDRASKNGSGATASNMAVALGREETLIKAALRTAESYLRIHRDPNGRWHPGRSFPSPPIPAI